MPIKISSDQIFLDNEKLDIKGQNTLFSEEATVNIIDYINSQIQYTHTADNVLKKWQIEDWDLLVENTTDFADKHLVLDWWKVSLLVQEEINWLHKRLSALLKLQSVLPWNNKDWDEKILVEVYVDE